jgi:putative ABC transport system permease protein
MFWRLLLQLLRGSRGRLAVALLALASGAAVISALLNLDLDMERKLTQEFRSLGANVVIAPRRTPGVADSAAMSGALMDQSEVLGAVENLHSPEVVAAAPMLYVVVQARGSNVVLAGTWLDQIPKLAPSWKISGEGIRSREDATHCLVGRNVARQLHAVPGSPLELDYLGRTAQLTLAGVVDSGGAEDNQIFANLPVAQILAGLDRQIGLVQLSVAGNSKTIEALEQKLSQALPGLEVRPIRQVTEAEGSLLNRIRLLIVSMVILILALTALCVLATMAALAMERRSDVGLMKALGGSITRIVGIFLAEVGVLGALGGLLGCFAGVALSNWMGRRVFGAAISIRWEIFPLTIAMMVGVALAAAFPLRLLGKIKPAVILRGE